MGTQLIAGLKSESSESLLLSKFGVCNARSFIYSQLLSQKCVPGGNVGLRVLVRCRPRLPSDVLDAVGKTMPETVRISGPNVVEIPNVRSDQESVRYRHATLCHNSEVVLSIVHGLDGLATISTYLPHCSFDGVYGADASQEHIFNEVARPMLKRILQGQNASVLAYGPTGAGVEQWLHGGALSSLDTDLPDNLYTQAKHIR